MGDKTSEKLSPQELQKPIDLREESDAREQEEGVKKLNLPELPKQLESYDKEHHLDEVAQVEKTKHKGESIINQGQIREKQEIIKNALEIVLGEGLDDLYLAMDKNQQQAFKLSGEKNSNDLRDIIIAGKMNREKVLTITRSWLKMIPNVNNFFIEQESKNRTDKVMEIYYKNSSTL